MAPCLVFSIINALRFIFLTFCVVQFLPSASGCNACHCHPQQTLPLMGWRMWGFEVWGDLGILSLKVFSFWVFFQNPLGGRDAIRWVSQFELSIMSFCLWPIFFFDKIVANLRFNSWFVLHCANSVLWCCFVVFCLMGFFYGDMDQMLYENHVNILT